MEARNDMTMAHPYMGASAPAQRQDLLDAVGVADTEELFAQIPPEHRLSRPLDLPPALRSEADLHRHLHDLLSRNLDCEANLSFLGSGCWQHYVPAVCEEIVQRTEFVTSELGTPASDAGRNQAWFEYQSQLGELLDLDFVSLPVYSWGCAVGHAVRMACRASGSRRVLAPANLDRERLAVLRTYCGHPALDGHIEIELIDHDGVTGQLDREHLEQLLSGDRGVLYFETPGSLGVIESGAEEIVRLAHEADSLAIVGVDPLSLGVLAPPGQYGADIAVGSIQPLGVHMNCGGGAGGFIASTEDPRLLREYPTLQMSVCPTTEPGERAFATALLDQTSYGRREGANDWTGNSVYLWAIAAATYMALVGPQGFAELGETILQRSHYAAQQLAMVPGVTVRWPGFFKELVVDFSETGRTVAQVNERLLAHGIFGGTDLSGTHPELGQAALYCVTELHQRSDIDRLAEALAQEVGR
jgi:glycine dehydrogenase subunit 1